MNLNDDIVYRCPWLGPLHQLHAGRSRGLIRAGGTLVTIAGPAGARPADGLTIDFVLVSDRAQLGEIIQRVRDGRLRTNIGTVATLDDAVAAFNRGRASSCTARPAQSVRW